MNKQGCVFYLSHLILGPNEQAGMRVLPKPLRIIEQEPLDNTSSATWTYDQVRHYKSPEIKQIKPPRINSLGALSLPFPASSRRRGWP
ncbi:MAG: hypothetical protein ACPGWR_01715 [Ardenticatenaceae bacterium]